MTTNNIETMLAQPRLQPGDQGYWQVWGASLHDLQAGDIFAWRRPLADSVVSEWLEVESAEVVSRGLQCHIVTTDGQDFYLGILCMVVIVRPGTKNTLARSCR